jgi:hypothetical protein
MAGGLTFPKACTSTSAVLITVQNLTEDPDGLSGVMYSDNALGALLYIPLLATNVIATILICYKAWLVWR